MNTKLQKLKLRNTSTSTCLLCAPEGFVAVNHGNDLRTFHLRECLYIECCWWIWRRGGVQDKKHLSALSRLN